MPRISSFALQYNNADYAEVAASSFDLFITEGRPLQDDAFAPLSDAEVLALIAQGRAVAGYVNVSVTDDTRPFWNRTPGAWTSNGLDWGVEAPGAPSWLKNRPIIDFAGTPSDPSDDARIVNYADPAWRQLVIDQAVDLVERGYNAIFLDDVGRYYQLSPMPGPANQQLARDMILLLEAVSAAVKAANPQARIIVNGDPFLGGNADAGWTGGGPSWSSRFLAAFDVMLLENPDSVGLDGAQAAILPSRPVVVLQSRTTWTMAELYARGFIPHQAGSVDYDDLGGYVGPQTEGADVFSGGDGPNRLEGAGGNDTISGGGGNDAILGGNGADALFGEDGADRLTGGSGNDTLNGGAGSDTAVFSGLRSAYVVSFSGAVVTVVGPDGTDTLTGVEFLQFSDMTIPAPNGEIQGTPGADSLQGTSGADVIRGLAGDDQLFGLDGDDVLAGGAGVDVLNGGAGIDTVDYSTAASAVRAQLNTNASSNDGDGGTDTFSSIENLTGSAFNDTLIGDNNANVLRGGLGADTLLGLGGNDVLWGGAGAANTLQGGLGDDRYVLETLDSVIEAAGEGTDTVEARIAAYALSANVENLVFGGTGNFTGTGNSGNNVITGGAGNDNLRGRGGVDVLNGGQGSDTVDYTLAAAGVTARLDLNRATNDGDGATDTFTGIENLTGSNFNDLLIGDNNANVLMGGIGTDTLLGFGGDDILMGGSGGGNNQLQGGQGNDWYVLDAFDTVVELAGEGIDTVEARVGSYTLAANVENLLYTGPGKFVGSGNALNNVITGGTQNDILKGGGGNDTINGGQGSDELQLRGTKAQYTVTVEGSGYRIVDTVAGRDGSTLVSSIEVLRFLTGNTTTALVYPPVAPIPPEGEGKAPAPLVSPIMDDPPVVLPAIHAKTFEDGPQVLPGPDDGKPELRALFALDNDLRAGPHALYIPPEPDLSVTDSRDWM